MIVPYFNLYFRDWVGASIPQIGTIFALGQFGTALGSFASPWITRRAGLIHGVLITQVLSLPFMALMAVQHSFWLCALCFIFRGAFMNMGMPIRQETLMEVMPARFRARAAATDSMSWNLAWAGSMFFSGSIIKNHGYGASLWIAVACYATSAVLYRWFFLDWERKRLTPKRKS